MPLFRKKPVIVQAMQFTVTEAVQAWLRSLDADFSCVNDAVFGPCLSINTLEGDMLARPGDWIIRGVNGEFYPCKPDIFDKTYEAAET